MARIVFLLSAKSYIHEHASNLLQLALNTEGNKSSMHLSGSCNQFIAIFRPKSLKIIYHLHIIKEASKSVLAAPLPSSVQETVLFDHLTELFSLWSLNSAHSFTYLFIYLFTFFTFPFSYSAPELPYLPCQVLSYDSPCVLGLTF